MITKQSYLQQLLVDIGSVINNYLMAKEHLNIVRNTSLQEMNEVLNQGAKDFRSLSERRDYCRFMREEVTSILDERRFSEFIEKAGSVFATSTAQFMRELSFEYQYFDSVQNRNRS